MNKFRQRCQETARRFLQTVVIVDDEAYIEPTQSPGPLDKPTRRAAVHMADGKAVETVRRDERPSHSLDASTLVEAFSKQGLICAVVAPRFDIDPSDIIDPSVKQTDIVILDWRLNRDNGEKTLSVLESILKEDAGERLRLIAIYTGEQEISGIGRTIVKRLAESGWTFERKERDVVLSCRHCRIVIYSKSKLPVESDFSDRSLPESDLPRRLIEDFASMTEGLLPNIALISLAAIRENAHKVLELFDAKLDPAFLTHRACLPVPDDSQQHMVSQLASELHAIMDDAVATGDPAGMDAIREWLDSSLGPNTELDFGKSKTASRGETIALLETGLDKEKPNNLSNKDVSRIFRRLTAIFSKNEDAENQLDHQLAWMFNFRTVFNAPPPILQLGTVLRKSDDANAPCFLCMRPKCDSVRLRDKTTFLLLPLIEPQPKSVQLVLRADENTYRRVGICTETNQWSLVSFVPSQKKGSVVAEGNYPCFYFDDEDDVRFHWLGELKSEFAQRVAQHFASGLSRVPINNSEWLRKEEA